MSTLLREYITLALIEGKLEDLQARNPEHADVLAKVNDVHHQYLDWAVKQLKAGANTSDLVPTLELFHSKKQKFPKRDLNQYKTLKELEDAGKDVLAKLDEPSKKQQKKAVKSTGTEKLHEDERYVVLYIKNRDASVCYGAGTRWCISARDTNYWNEYSGDNYVIYFIIDKTLPADDPMAKVAVGWKREYVNGAGGRSPPVLYDQTMDATDSPLDDYDKRMTKELSRLKELTRRHAEGVPDTKHYRIRASEDPYYENALSPWEMEAALKDPETRVTAIESGRLHAADVELYWNDPDPEVRKAVVRRAGPEVLQQMATVEENAQVLVKLAARYGQHVWTLFDRFKGVEDASAERAAGNERSADDDARDDALGVLDKVIDTITEERGLLNLAKRSREIASNELRKHVLMLATAQGEPWRYPHILEPFVDDPDEGIRAHLVAVASNTLEKRNPTEGAKVRLSALLRQMAETDPSARVWGLARQRVADLDMLRKLGPSA